MLIAILDSGIDPGIPGLSLTSDGSPKVIDLRDFSDEGRVRLQRAVRHDDTLIVGNRRILGASRVAALAGDSPIWGGSIAELGLGKAPAADLNGNGVVGDTLRLSSLRKPPPAGCCSRIPMVTARWQTSDRCTTTSWPANSSAGISTPAAIRSAEPLRLTSPSTLQIPPVRPCSTSFSTPAATEPTSPGLPRAMTCTVWQGTMAWRPGPRSSA